MPLFKFRMSRQLVQVVFALVALGVMVTSAKMWNRMLRGKDLTASQAEARLRTARQNLEAGRQLTNSAQTIAMQIGSTNTAQLIRSMGSNWVEQLDWETRRAQIDLHMAHLAKTANTCVARYEDYNQAQEVIAALDLWNIPSILTGGPSKSKPEGARPPRELLVPHEKVQRALELVRDPQMVQVMSTTNFLSADATRAALILQHISCVVRPMETPEPRTPTTWSYVAFVHARDKELALEIIGRSSK